MAEQKKEKTYKIRIPLTPEKQGDVYVSVNEREWQIQRGKEVEVPECVYEVIMNKQKAEEEAMMRAMGLQGKSIEL